MTPTDTVPENEPALDSTVPKAGISSVPLSAVPSHVRRISKGGSGDYTHNAPQVLSSDATKAMNMVKKMAAEPTSEGTPKASKNAMIPLNYLKRCKGIQFVVTKLGGLFVSVQRGHSFVIQRLDSDASGRSKWSGPCFGSISNVGLGLTAGYDALDTVVILGNQMTVDKLKTAEPKFGVDIDLIVGRDSTIAQTDSNWTEEETAAIPFTLAGGALFDVSLKGGAHTINHKKNKAIYGTDVTPEDILEGKVAPPAEFAPLYELLNNLAAAAPEELDDPLIN